LRSDPRLATMKLSVGITASGSLDAS